MKIFQKIPEPKINSSPSRNSENEENKEDIEKVEEKILELEDKLARLLPKWKTKEEDLKKKREAYEYGGFNFAKEALTLIDNFERSKQILKSDESIKDSEILNKILEHFDIINEDLISIFAKNDIKPIECLNKKLDPNFHQAMMEIEDEQKEAGTIIQEIQKGFTIKNRLLRPSLVGVSKKPIYKDKKDEENKEELDKK